MRKRQIKVAGDIILGMVERTHFACLRSIILLLVILMSSVSAYAYVVGEYFVKDHITYRVIDASASNPKLAVYNVRGVSGKVTIPSKVFDGKDVYFNVKQI